MRKGNQVGRSGLSRGSNTSSIICSPVRLLFGGVLIMSGMFIFHFTSMHPSLFDIKSEQYDLLLRIRQNTNTEPVPSIVKSTHDNQHTNHNVNNINTEPIKNNIISDVNNNNNNYKINIEKEIISNGFINHKILKLSDDLFRSTPVSIMMLDYGESLGGGSCSQDFGNSLINKWRARKENVCKSNLNNEGVLSVESNSLNSSIDCYHVFQTRHHGNGDNLCVLRNVVVNMALFADSSITSSVVKKYVDTKHNVQPYISFPKGFIQGDCMPNEKKGWSESFMPGWNADWTTKSFVSEPSLSDTICEEWIPHKVLVTQRDTFANFFHDSEDFVNVFLAMAILELNSISTQMYLTDLYPQGAFWDMWSKVYSSGLDAAKAMTAWDLNKKYHNNNHNHDSMRIRKNVCFKELIIGIYGPAAPITVASWDTPCSQTALVRAYADYVIRGMGLQSKTHYANTQPLTTVVVTYMSRKPSKEWPEKKYCDSENSFFLCR
eukprot:gene9752-13119_t